MRRALLALPLLLPACRSHDEPTWAKGRPGVAGEPTIGGEPARATRAAAPPIIDGKLDDAAWAGATVLGPLVDPGSGDPRGDGTFVRILWDDQKLYLGFVVRDARPSSPFQRDDVDPHIWSAASGIELMLQPGDPGDNGAYHEIQVDVAGAVWDTQFDDYNVPITGQGDARRYGHQEWKSGLERQTFTGGGWYAVEMAMPWVNLAPARTNLPPAAGDVWRLNLYTFRDGQRQALAWSPLHGEGNFHYARRFGRVRFERE